MFKYFMVAVNIFVAIYSKECPPKELLNPCQCVDNDIICSTNETLNLRNIFQKLSASLPEKDKHFHEFFLSNNAITELEDNVFVDITFKSIYIKDAINLERISKYAFNGTEEWVKSYFAQEGVSKLASNPNELFDALSSLKYIQWIDFDHNLMTEIPENAFRNAKSHNIDLLDIDFNYWRKPLNRLKSIGNNAFYYLSKIQRIYITQHQIDYIPSKAFDFELESNETLQIDLWRNNLNGSSFENGLFVNSKRPLTVYLEDNKNLSFLDEKVFAPFLKKDIRNKLHIRGSLLDCDCKSFWLIRDRSLYEPQVANGLCKSGKLLWSLDNNHFAKCSLHFNE